jgi:chromate transporter
MQVCRMAEASTPPDFRAALRFWAKLGCISFGGPSGQIAIMHEELVARRGWISEMEFLHGLNFCMMLPGPEAQQLATYLGWRLHGVRGALAGGILFVLPAVFILWALSLIYVLAGTVPVVAAAFYGLGPAVMAIIARALLNLSKKTLKRPIDWIIALTAGLLMFHFRGSYPIVVLGAGVVGMIVNSRSGKKSPQQIPEPQGDLRLLPILRNGLICLLAWWIPPLIALALLGRDSTVVTEGIFFSKAALVTFGGAYAVLPYVAQHAVVQYHWLSADDMLHGFGLAETTPGPLVIVLQFVAFLGAWHHPGALPPLLAATLGSLLTTWVTFAPSFLYILVGAPFLERMIRLEFLQGALRAISAAVVGVMADFAIWFGGNLLFPAHRFTNPDFFVLVVGLGALAMLLRFRVSVPVLLGVCAVLGILYRTLLPQG